MMRLEEGEKGRTAGSVMRQQRGIKHSQSWARRDESQVHFSLSLPLVT